MYKQRWYKSLAFIALMYGLGIAAIWWDGAQSSYQPAEYAVVLGNQVYRNGQLSKRLQARVNRSAELYRQGTVKRIIVSGGIGKEGQDEALAMRDFLVQQGIPFNAIVTDSKGANTQLTAQNALQWASPEQPIIVVSQLYHLSRTKMAFQQAGFQQVGAAYPDYFERRDIYASVRELPAWLSYALGKS